MCGGGSSRRERVYYRPTEWPEPDLQVAEAALSCPKCGSPVEEDFVLCPRCGTQLKRSCPSCHKAVDVDWIACPYCGTDLSTPA
jgi:RNA polymerase subunit RPABC4/transcription elongation factor Spt4